MRFRALFVFALLLMCAAPVFAQQTPIIPPGTGQAVFCFTQNDPQPASWRYILNGVGPTATPAMDNPIYSACSAASTHSFRLPGSQFPLGNYAVVVQSISPGGQVTNGPEYQFSVDIQSGTAVVTGVFSAPSGQTLRPATVKPSTVKPKPDADFAGEPEA